MVGYAPAFGGKPDVSSNVFSVLTCQIDFGMLGLGNCVSPWTNHEVSPRQLARNAGRGDCYSHQNTT